MKVLPINNQPQFRAKLPKSEINTLVGSALSNDSTAGIPKLYTLLKKLEKMPGKKAEIKTIIRNSQSDIVGFALGYSKSNSCQLRIDGTLEKEGDDIYRLLYSYVTSKKLPGNKEIPMPQAVFDPMWWKNADKTYRDIEKLLI